MNEGPKESGGLASSLDVSISELPSITGLLEESYLITGKNGIYALTRIGELIVEKLKPLLCIETTMNAAEGFWRSRNLDFIPSPLLKKLHKLNSCTIIKPNFPDIYDYNREVHEMSKASGSVSVAATCLHPAFPELFSEILERRINLSLIFDICLFDKVRKDHSEHIRSLLKNRKVELYVYAEDMPFLSFKVNDACIELKLLTDKGTYDYKRLVCCSPDAVEWGKELFEHYRQQSVRVSAI
ncbi:hypothetical protein PV02_01955 [Methanolobus chelungpuianus]|uniref:Methanogenesis regulatory protein FilR1 middle domain-containing protein n=1 Tax=Methanolobus chelungpuianus TaxID=502115 RepID=A0AAE3HA01_9EURY|nr:hypothetical protein [Methanolobus chelungpuianus]